MTQSAATAAQPASTALSGTLLSAAGASRIDASLADIPFTNLNAVFQQLENTMEAGTSGYFAQGVGAAGNGLLQNLRAAILQAIANGIASLPGADRRTVAQNTTLAPNVAAAIFAANTTPSNFNLQAAILVNTALSGSVVDSTGRVYAATGLVDAGGVLTIAARSQDNQSLSLTGTVSQAVNGVSAVHGSVTYTVGGVSTTGFFTGATQTIGTCATQTQSGGQGTFSYFVNLGRSAGAFDVTYQMNSIPDGMNIVLGGREVFTTNGLVSGISSTTVTYSSADTAIVNMFAPNSGTAWDFTVGCAP